MDTLLVTQDPSPPAASGIRSGAAGASNGREGGLFSSTLQQQMQPENSADDSAANSDTATTSAGKPAQAPRKPSAAAATQGVDKAVRTEAASTAAATSDVLSAETGKLAQTLELIPDISSFKPLQDDATDDVTADTDTSPEEELATASAVIIAVDTSAVPLPLPLSDKLAIDLATDTNSSLPEAGTAANKTLAAGNDSNMTYLQTMLNRFSRQQDKDTTAPQATKLPALDGNSLQDSGKLLPLKDSADSATAFARALTAPASSSNASSRNDTNFARFFDKLLPQSMGATQNSTDTVQLQYAPSAVLAPEVDGSSLQNLSAIVSPGTGSSSAANSSDALNSNRGITTGSSPFTLQSELYAGSEGWNDDLGAKITWLSHQKIGKAEISLHPAELGAIDISIDHDNDRISVSIVTRNDAARELLESSMPRLSELLRSNGLSLEQGTVSQHSASSGQGNPQSGLGSNQQSNTAESETLNIADIRARSALLHRGQIDHYV